MDDSGFIVPTGKTSITSKNVMTLVAQRENPTSLAIGESTVKLVHNDKVYDTVTITYRPSISITTNSSEHLTTDLEQTITLLKVNGVESSFENFSIVSADEEIARVQNGTVIVPVKSGTGTFEIYENSNPESRASFTMSFYDPNVKVGDTYTRTLSNAFKLAQSGDTIVLQNDISESVSFGGQTPRVQDFELFIDLNGHS